MFIVARWQLLATHRDPPACVLGVSCRCVRPVKVEGNLQHSAESSDLSTRPPSLKSKRIPGTSTTLGARWDDSSCANRFEVFVRRSFRLGKCICGTCILVWSRGCDGFPAVEFVLSYMHHLV